MNKLLIFFLAVTFMAACKDKSVESTSTESAQSEEQTFQSAQPDKVVNPLELPDPCTLISKEEIAAIFSCEANSITTKPGMSGQGQDFSESCFITWDKDGEKL